MFLVVGLGNPGKKYDKTRHNAGFMFIDSLKVGDYKLKFDGLYNEAFINGEKYIFLKPQLYMNFSGVVVKKYMDYFSIERKNILIVYDDVDFEIGVYKLRETGGAGGHNGIKNIIDQIGSKSFNRVRIGIGSDTSLDKVDFVLSKFSKDDIYNLNEVFKELKNTIENLTVDKFSNLMNSYN